MLLHSLDDWNKRYFLRNWQNSWNSIYGHINRLWPQISDYHLLIDTFIYQSVAFQYAVRRWILVPQFYKESPILPTLPPFKFCPTSQPSFFALFPWLISDCSTSNMLVYLMISPLQLRTKACEANNPWKDIWQKKIKHNRRRLENFNICFCVSFDLYYQGLISAGMHWELAHFLTQVRDFPIMS